jgi:phenylalanyl-tRNA synthetase beta chain
MASGGAVMPVVGVPINRLGYLLGQDISRDELDEALKHLGCDVEGFATLSRFQCRNCGFVMEKTETETAPGRCEDCGVDFSAQPELAAVLDSVEVIRLDLLPVRPDMFDVGGLARTLRAYVGMQPGLRQYTLAAPSIEVEVKPGLDESDCFRPCIVCAVVRNVRFDSDSLKELMRLQENLHWALGRDRKRASIGVYDLEGLASSLVYRPVAPEELTFTPLGWHTPKTPKEILEQHVKGVAFAHLLDGFSRYPLLADERGQVLSMPPIINSEETRVSLDSHDLFMDVTGPRLEVVEKALNIIVTSTLEAFEDATAEQVEIIYPSGRRYFTPDLSPQLMTLDLQQTRKLVGIDLTPKIAADALERMGHGVELSIGDEIRVSIPPYRSDFLHQRDLMEDLAIGYGYHRIPRVLVPTMTVGSAVPDAERAAVARRALTGLGGIEVMTLILGNEEGQYSMFGRETPDDAALIANPISAEQTLLRTWLLPGLLQTLSRNTSRELPQEIFEVGDVVLVDEQAEARTRDKKKAAIALTGSGIGFADIRSMMDSLLLELGLSLQIRPASRPYYLEGRAAELVDQHDAVQGEFGEIHPRVLEGFNLGHPVAVGEVFLTG